VIGLPSFSAKEQRSLIRYYCRTDLFFLLYFALGRKDIFHPWLFERCREIEKEPDDRLDLWAREHYKSTIITFAKTFQDILASHGEDPLPKWNGKEITCGIFSHTRPSAKSFLRQIKYECESNIILRSFFDDVIWENPKKEAPKWSEDDGLIMKRKSNPKESTVEAHGVVDGQPTGKHFDILIYDDLVTEKSVSTEDMRSKTTEQLVLSYNLGAHGGKRRFIGTRYHFNDTYKVIMDRNTAIPRVHAATEDGTVDGKPVFITEEALKKKRADQGPYVFGCQMLQDPKSEDAQGFKPEWLKYWSMEPLNTNNYILVDPAGSKNKGSDYTSMWVVGLGADNNYYCLSFFRDRLNLTERAAKLFELHQQYLPLGVAYEKYGMQADIEHIEYEMEVKNYRFDITQVGSNMPKGDRIKRLVPLFEKKRIYLPKKMFYKRRDGAMEDMTHIFVNEEYLPFPVGHHPDMLDSLSRIVESDLQAVFPRKSNHEQSLQQDFRHIV